MASWFEQLFGFPERDYHETQAQFLLEGTRVVSRANGRSFDAVSCDDPRISDAQWAPLTTLVLDAAYESTLWAAAIDHATGHGNGRVWLTFLGGGAFQNDPDWIGQAIGRTLARLDGIALDVRIAHYRTLDHEMIDRIDQAR